MSREHGTQGIVRILIAAILLVTLPGAAKDTFSVDKLALLDLLQAKRFDELNAELAEYQRGFERGERADHDINGALFAFATTRQGVIEQLDLWAQAYPDSEFPLLARSKYHRHNGLIARGESFGAETAREQFDAMNRHFDRAAADATRAIAINPMATAGYADLISMATYGGKKPARDRLVEVALDAAPTSELVRSEYLGTLVPWWGGSLEQIRAFIEKSKQSLSSPEQGHPLDGYEHYVKGLMAARNGKRKEAAAHFDKALGFGEILNYRLARARNTLAMRQGDWGRADFERSLQLAPQDPRLLDSAATHFAIRRDFKRAEQLWRLALELDPRNPTILMTRAFHRSNVAKFQEAREDLDRSMVLGSLYHYNRFLRGQLNLVRLDNRSEARIDFEIATRVAPNHAEYWYHFAESLTEGPSSELPECKAVEAFEKYVELCHRQGDCDENQLLTAEYFTAERPEIYGSC